MNHPGTRIWFMFYPISLHPVGEGGFSTLCLWGCLNIQHSKNNKTRLTAIYLSHILTAQVEKTLHSIEDHMEIALRNRLEKIGAVEAGFIISRRWGVCLVPAGGSVCLACLNNSVCCQGTETYYSGMSREYAESLYLSRGFY